MTANRRYSRPPTPSSVEPAIDVLRTGSVVLRLLPRPPMESFYGYERRVRAMYHELAAVLEIKTDEERCSWVVALDLSRPELTLEVVGKGDSGAALHVMILALDSLGYQPPEE